MHKQKKGGGGKIINRILNCIQFTLNKNVDNWDDEIGLKNGKKEFN